MRRVPSGPRTIIVVIGDHPSAATIDALCERVRVLLVHSGVELIICDVGRLADPDLVAIDLLAHLQLTARRLGRSIRLQPAATELQDLLALVGLSEALPLRPTSVLEAEGLAEQREQVRVDEEVDRGDAAT